MAFLGYVVIGIRIFVDLNKVEAIVHWDQLKNSSEIWSFLGLVGYYHQFVEGFSMIATP